MQQDQLISVSFEVQGIPPLPNTTKGMHHMQLHKIKKEWTDKVHLLAQEAKLKEGLKGLYDTAAIHYHISVGSNRRIDSDNLDWAVKKPANDGLIGVFIPDDDIDTIKTTSSYDRTSPKRFMIIITGR